MEIGDPFQGFVVGRFFFFGWVVWGRSEVQYSTAAGGLESYSME